MLEFEFANIMLPDSGTNYNASMGHVIYRVDQNPGLAPLTQIYNSAYIFFDYNLPIVTNQTLNTIMNPTSVAIVGGDDHNLKLFPNPANDVINVISSAPCSLVIIDINGRIILEKEDCGKQSTIDITSFKQGVYFIRINSEDFVESARIIKL